MPSQIRKEKSWRKRQPDLDRSPQEREILYDADAQRRRELMTSLKRKSDTTARKGGCLPLSSWTQREGKGRYCQEKAGGPATKDT